MCMLAPMKRMKRSELKALGKLLRQQFGRLGGIARAAKLTKKRRSQIARAAANARWTKDRKTA